jgi:hypothetical protein
MWFPIMLDLIKMSYLKFLTSYGRNLGVVGKMIQWPKVMFHEVLLISMFTGSKMDCEEEN